MTSEPEQGKQPDPAADRERHREESLKRLREVIVLGDLNELQRAIRRHVTFFAETEQIVLPRGLYARLRDCVEQQNPRVQTIKTAVDGSLFIQKTMIVEGPDNG